MIGDRIKKAREYTGTKQKKLADEVGISPQHLYQYESNRRIPKIETLRKIAGAMGLIVSYNAGGHPYFDLKDEDLSRISHSDNSKEYEAFFNWQMNDIDGEESLYSGAKLTVDFGDGKEEYTLDKDGIASGWVTPKDEVIRNLSEMNEAGHQAMLQFSRIIATHPDYLKPDNKKDTD